MTESDMDKLENAVNRLIAENDRLHAVNAELREVLEGMIVNSCCISSPPPHQLISAAVHTVEPV